MVVGNLQGDLKIYAHLQSDGSTDMPWKIAKLNGQISAIKITPYNNALLGKMLKNTKNSILNEFSKPQ